MKMNKLAELLSKEGGSNLAEINKILEASLSEAEAVEEVSEEEVSEEEVEEETSEETEEIEETEETEEIEEAEEAIEEESEEEETELASIISSLTDELTALRQENKDLKEKLAAKLAEEKSFVDKFKQLSVSLTKETPKATTPKSSYTDGIGE